MDKKTDESFSADAHSPYWRLLRDVVVFQGKLALDGLRDLLLSPLSIILALAGAVLSPTDPHRYLRRLMQFGLRTDQFINLFEHTEAMHAPTHNSLQADAGNPSISNNLDKVSSNTYVKQLEDLLIDEYHKGGVVRGVKEGTDQIIRKLMARRQPPPE
ncbi:MAG: hypothetical protein ACI96P_002348 [Candidatus Azotimanducaceae bacterium]|jgi:hypothetical protein